MVPVKTVETETQRSVKARHVRSIRRSTQGVSSEEVEQAKKLVNHENCDSHLISSSTNVSNITKSSTVESGYVPRSNALNSHSSMRSITLNPVVQTSSSPTSISTDLSSNNNSGTNRRVYLKHSISQSPSTTNDMYISHSSSPLYKKSSENLDNYGSTVRLFTFLLIFKI